MATEGFERGEETEREREERERERVEREAREAAERAAQPQESALAPGMSREQVQAQVYQPPPQATEPTLGQLPDDREKYPAAGYQGVPQGTSMTTPEGNRWVWDDMTRSYFAGGPQGEMVRATAPVRDERPGMVKGGFMDYILNEAGHDPAARAFFGGMGYEGADPLKGQPISEAEVRNREPRDFSMTGPPQGLGVTRGDMQPYANPPGAGGEAFPGSAEQPRSVQDANLQQATQARRPEAAAVGWTDPDGQGVRSAVVGYLYGQDGKLEYKIIRAPDNTTNWWYNERTQTYERSEPVGAMTGESLETAAGRANAGRPPDAPPQSTAAAPANPEVESFLSRNPGPGQQSQPQAQPQPSPYVPPSGVNLVGEPNVRQAAALLRPPDYSAMGTASALPEPPPGSQPVDNTGMLAQDPSGQVWQRTDAGWVRFDPNSSIGFRF
jgi:hypothetical protein